MIVLFFALLLFCTFSITEALPTISVTGAKFFLSTGTQLFIKGVAYNSRDGQLTDVLVDGEQCSKDADLMKVLGANSINVYYVDVTANHTECMSIFEDAGIYVWISLSTPFSFIDRLDPQWTPGLYTNYTRVLDAFASFENTAGFWVGVEIITDTNFTTLAPYIKAAARDVKAYRDAKGYRPIPVGYQAADNEGTEALQDYLGCGFNRSETVDFYGWDRYSWCPGSSYTTSGYDLIMQNATGYAIPIFFSETGCTLSNISRDFEDQEAILGPLMNNVFSGSIVYEWVMAANGYGLIDDVNGQPSPDPSGGFLALQSQWSTLNPTGTPSVAYYPSLTPGPCPSYTSGVWLVDGNVALPTPAYSTLPDKVITTAVSLSTPNSSAQTSQPSISPSSPTPAAGGGTSQVSTSTTNATSGLSTGAIAGIVIGVIALVVIAVGIAFIWWYRRRQAVADAANGSRKPEARFEKPELQGTSVERPDDPTELDIEAPPREINGKPIIRTGKPGGVFELPGSDARRELAETGVARDEDGPDLYDP